VHERDDHLVRQALRKAEVLTEVQLRVAEDYQRSVGGSLRDIVVRLGLAGQEDVARALAAQDALVVDRDHIAREYASKLPLKLLQGYCVLPLHSSEGVVLACEQEPEPIVCEELWDLLGVRLPMRTVPQGTVACVLEELSRSRSVRTAAAAAADAPPAALPPPAASPPPAALPPAALRAPVAAAYARPEPPRAGGPQPLPEIGVRELTAFLIARGIITEADVRAFAAACRAMGPSSGA